MIERNVEIKLKSGAMVWSSGQRARLLLWQSEFESRWRLQFFSVKIVFEKNENKQNRLGLAHLKKKCLNW